MNRKITDLALAGKCDSLAASGFNRGPAASASRASSDCNARAPNPFAAPRSTSRRRQACFREVGSRDIGKLAPVQQCQTEILPPPAALEKSARHLDLYLSRRSCERHLVHPTQPAAFIAAALPLEPCRECFRLPGHQIAIHQRQCL